MPSQVAMLLAMVPDSSLKAPFIEHSRLVSVAWRSLRAIIGKELRDGQAISSRSICQQKPPAPHTCAPLGAGGAWTAVYTEVPEWQATAARPDRGASHFGRASAQFY